MEAIEKKFKENEKAEAASRLTRSFYDLKYNGFGGVREHLLKLININARLKEMWMGVNDAQVVHTALHSQPNSFSALKTSYTAQRGDWTVDEMISIYVGEEEKFMKEGGYTPTVNLVGKSNKKKNKLKATKTIAKPSSNTATSKETHAFKFKCCFCKKVGHIKKDCSGFKAWLEKKGIHREEGTKK